MLPLRLLNVSKQYVCFNIFTVKRIIELSVSYWCFLETLFLASWIYTSSTKLSRYIWLCWTSLGDVPAATSALLGVAGGPGADGGPAGWPLPWWDVAGSCHLAGGTGHCILAQNAAFQQRLGDGDPTAGWGADRFCCCGFRSLQDILIFVALSSQCLVHLFHLPFVVSAVTCWADESLFSLLRHLHQLIIGGSTVW